MVGKFNWAIFNINNFVLLGRLRLHRELVYMDAKDGHRGRLNQNVVSYVHLLFWFQTQEFQYAYIVLDQLDVNVFQWPRRNHYFRIL
jgi:hypothetical protein